MVKASFYRPVVEIIPTVSAWTGAISSSAAPGYYPEQMYIVAPFLRGGLSRWGGMMAGQNRMVQYERTEEGLPPGSPDDNTCCCHASDVSGPRNDSRCGQLPVMVVTPQGAGIIQRKEESRQHRQIGD
jgi:hypothetical protein